MAQDEPDANDQEKATLPASERGDATLDVGDTGASESANERYEKAGGLAKSDESDIPVPDPKASGASETPQMDGEDDADAPDDPNEDAVTQAQESFDPQIKPDFFSLDETALDRWITGFTKYLRAQGFVVNGPTAGQATNENEDMPVGISGEVSTRRLPSDEEHVVYESKYQWRREDAKESPITVIETSLLSPLAAKQNTMQTAYARRLEI